MEVFGFQTWVKVSHWGFKLKSWLIWGIYDGVSVRIQHFFCRLLLSSAHSTGLQTQTRGHTHKHAHTLTHKAVKADVKKQFQSYSRLASSIKGITNQKTRQPITGCTH